VIDEFVTAESAARENDQMAVKAPDDGDQICGVLVGKSRNNARMAAPSQWNWPK
jgi:hypothetical protein